MKTTGILGYGRFGRTLADLHQRAGLPWCAHEPVATVPRANRCEDVDALCRRAEQIAVAVPLGMIPDALRRLRPHLEPRHTLFDVGSVKLAPTLALQETLGDEIPWVATHPLFGPNSVARGESLRVVICPGPHPAALRQVREHYEALGCEVVQREAEHHDRSMAYTHALTFFVTRAMLELDLGDALEAAPPSFRAMAHTIETVRGDAGHLFSAMQRQNPFAAQARRDLLEAMERVDQQLLQGKPTEIAAVAATTAAPLAPEQSLAHARSEIDACDRDLVTLLGRRQRLALQAGAAKALLERPVLDSSREEQVLEQRNAWGSAAGLDPAAVTRVFEIVMEISRGAQESAQRVE